MVRIIDIVHFRDNKVSSKIVVDSADPYLKEGKYVQSGGFFVKPELEGQSMKLSLQEALNFAVRLQEECKRLIGVETQMRIEQKEYKR